MDLCYICGQPLSAPVNRDHVPPQQFYAARLRQQFNLDRLKTVQTHEACNDAFKKDEEYFVWSLSPLAHDTVGGVALREEQSAKVRSRSRLGLAAAVRAEFDERPSGLYLPNGLVVKRLDSVRIERVAWKLIRGLFYLETGAILPDGTKHLLEIIAPHDKTPRHLTDFWDEVRRQPSKGEYQAIFAYKYLRAVAEDDPECPPLHLWALLLWDRIIVYVGHFDPSGKPR